MGGTINIRLPRPAPRRCKEAWERFASTAIKVYGTKFTTTGALLDGNSLAVTNGGSLPIPSGGGNQTSAGYRLRHAGAHHHDEQRQRQDR